MKEYNGWLVSRNTLKRSLAIVGHFFLGYIIIILSAGIFVGLITLLFNI